MFSWLGNDDRRKKDPEVFQTVSDGLKKLYKTKLLPLEEYYRFHEFHSPALEDADFDNKPMVLLVGQYSTGKTTFIRYLLETTLSLGSPTMNALCRDMYQMCEDGELLTTPCRAGISS